ncbi:hypothetical protein WDW86_00020 [Bdellovibrionota bacterium FG-2]
MLKTLFTIILAVNFAPTALAAPDSQSQVTTTQILALDPTPDPSVFEMQVAETVPVDSLILAKRDGKKVAAFSVLAIGKRLRVKLTREYITPFPKKPWEGAVRLPDQVSRLEIGAKNSKIQPLSSSENENAGSKGNSFSVMNRERARFGVSLFTSRKISSFTTSALQNLAKDPYWEFGGILGYQFGPYFRLYGGASVSLVSSAELAMTWTTFHGGFTAFIPGWNLSPLIGLNVDYTPYSYKSATALFSSRLLTLSTPLGLAYQHRSGMHFSLAFYPLQWTSFNYSSSDTSFTRSETLVLKDMPLVFQIGYYLGVSRSGNEMQREFMKHD